MSKPKRRRRTRPRQSSAEPWRAYLQQGRNDPQEVAFAKREHELHELRLGIWRRWVNVSGRVHSCHRKACRRAGVCSGPECLFDPEPPYEETAEDSAALAKFRDALRALRAAAGGE